MLTAGVDIGSLTTKAVILRAADSEVLGSALQPTGWRPKQAGCQVLAQALEQAELARADLDTVVATGYGRVSLPEADTTVTEVSCQARGIHLLLPQVRTIVDIGGQDSKVIVIDEQGQIQDFALNDRCAAGTGRFLEVMAAALEVEVAQLGELATQAAQPAKISSTCTVFAESEVVGLLAAGESPENMAAGLCRAIAQRVASLMQQAHWEPPVSLVGGVAYNEGVRQAIAQLLETTVSVPDRPQLTCAYGAAAWGAQVAQGIQGWHSTATIADKSHYESH